MHNKIIQSLPDCELKGLLETLYTQLPKLPERENPSPVIKFLRYFSMTDDITANYIDNILINFKNTFLLKPVLNEYAEGITVNDIRYIGNYNLYFDLEAVYNNQDNINEQPEKVIFDFLSFLLYFNKLDLQLELQMSLNITLINHSLEEMKTNLLIGKLQTAGGN
jgi:predicted RNA-binding protein Jag